MMTGVLPAMEVGQQFMVKLRVAERVRVLLYTVHDCSRSGRRYRIEAHFSTSAACAFEEDPQLIVNALWNGVEGLSACGD